MAKYFLSRDDSGRNDWWTYLLTLAIVYTGLVGFGGLPIQIAVRMKGLSPEQLQGFGLEDLYTLFSKNTMLILLMIPFIIGFLMLILAIRYVHHKPALPYFTVRKQLDIRRIFAGFLIWGTILGLVFTIGYFADPGGLQWNFEPKQFFMLLLICIFIVPVQTGFEELLCRGYILKSAGRITAKGIFPILISTLVFAALHVNTADFSKVGVMAMVFYIASGIFTALITVMDDGIELSWGFHIANNFLSLLIVSNSWQIPRTDSLFLNTAKPDEVGYELFLIIGVCYPVALFVMARIYKWSGWKKRLFGNQQL